MPHYSKWFYKKTALITGATSGIGREISKKLVQYDSDVLVCGRDIKAMDSLVEELIQISHSPLGRFIIDFSNDSSLSELISEIKERYEIDILVNNAGFGHMEDFYLIPQDRICSMLEVNISAVVHLCREFVPKMIKKPGTGIMNIGSTASFFATPGSALYGATKRFILGFTDALHQEMFPFHVHVTGVYPGHTRSRFIERATTGKVKNWEKAMDPELVAIEALKGLRYNKVRVVPGFGNKLRTFIGSVSPPNIISKRIYTKALKSYRG